MSSRTPRTPRPPAAPRLALALTFMTLAGCECVAPPPPNPNAPVARITAVILEDGGFDLVLSNIERPVRSLQVDVRLDGALATSIAATGGSDVAEAGLDTPKDDFTAVIADTRRLNLPAGVVARVSTGLDLNSVTLSRALAVDDSGALRDVTVVVP